MCFINFLHKVMYYVKLKINRLYICCMSLALKFNHGYPVNESIGQYIFISPL